MISRTTELFEDTTKSISPFMLASLPVIAHLPLRLLIWLNMASWLGDAADTTRGSVLLRLVAQAPRASPARTMATMVFMCGFLRVSGLFLGWPNPACPTRTGY